MISFNFVACYERRVFLEKSKTSSDKSLRILSAFSQRAWEDLASEQISETKFYHEDVHSYLTIEIKVAFSFVSKCWLCCIIASSSESLSTRLMIKLLIPCFWSSGRIFHLVYFIKLQEKANLHLQLHQGSKGQKTLCLGFVPARGFCLQPTMNLDLT